MTFRAFAIPVTLAGCLAGLSAILAEPEILSRAGAKLAEGGLWTALAAFVLGAAVLGVWPRDAEGRPLRPGRRRR